MSISVLGAGAWGTAIAISLSCKRDVILWTRNKTTIESINRARESDKLFGCRIPDKVLVKSDIEGVVDSSEILLAVPTQSLREVCQKLYNFGLKKDVPIILACKGIEKSTLKLPSEIVNELLPDNKVAFFSGPSLAIEVAKKLPYSMVLACKNTLLGQKLMTDLEQENNKLYFSSDIIGVQICAAVKNVFAIACGIILGKKLGYNAHAALLTNSINEMKILYLKKTGNPSMDTLFGPACFGDLVMTCTSLNSRNFSFGFKIGNKNNDFNIYDISSGGKSLIPEGVSTAQSVFNLAKKLKVKMPICEAVYRFLYKSASIEDTIFALMN